MYSARVFGGRELAEQDLASEGRHGVYSHSTFPEHSKGEGLSRDRERALC
jgi:hypothetical protein